jgi:hypothetical protein
MVSTTNRDGEAGTHVAEMVLPVMLYSGGIEKAGKGVMDDVGRECVFAYASKNEYENEAEQGGQRRIRLFQTSLTDSDDGPSHLVLDDVTRHSSILLRREHLIWVLVRQHR